MQDSYALSIVLANVKKEKVLIVGGGFGGVRAALKLSSDSRFDVTLLSDETDFRYYPALYHTATGGTRANSSISLTTIFKNQPVKLVRGRAADIDRKSKMIITEAGVNYAYETLILSLGVVTNYFGIPGLPDYSYSIKSQDEVEKLKEHLHQQLIDERKPDLSYVIIGAGPTGIELAGSLPAYLTEVMKRHGLPRRKIHVDLIEAAPTLLPRLPKDVSRSVGKRLRKLKVKLHVNSIVQGQTPDELTVSGKPIRSHTVIWTAGVTNNPFFSDNHFVMMGRGKVGVDTYLQTEENVFVIGDNANTPYSGMAQTALYDGEFVGENLIRRADGKDMHSYKAKKPVTVIPAGKNWAAVTYGKLRLYGRLGYLLRTLADLIGFHDLEPWQIATKQWLTQFEYQETCVVCNIALASRKN